MRFGDFVDRFQMRTPIGEGEDLAASVRALDLQGHRSVTEDRSRIMMTLEPYAKPRRDPVLVNFEQQHVAGSRFSSCCRSPSMTAA